MHAEGPCVSSSRLNDLRPPDNENLAWSEESMGDIGLRQLCKCMIQRNFHDTEGAEAVGFSHGQFGLVIEALDHPAREPSFGPEIIEEQLTMAAQRPCDLLHGLDARSHDLLA